MPAFWLDPWNALGFVASLSQEVAETAIAHADERDTFGVGTGPILAAARYVIGVHDETASKPLGRRHPQLITAERRENELYRMQYCYWPLLPASTFFLNGLHIIRWATSYPLYYDLQTMRDTAEAADRVAYTARRVGLTDSRVVEVEATWRLKDIQRELSTDARLAFEAILMAGDSEAAVAFARTAPQA